MAIFTKTGYTKKYCFLHPWKTISYKLSDIKCAWQRANKGYCFRDVWDLDNWFLRIMPEMLDDFVKEHNAHPNDMTDEEWVEILNRMAKAFRNAHEETTEFINPYEEEFLSTLTLDSKHGNVNCTASDKLRENFHTAENEKEEFMQKSLDEGISLFHKHFHSLWD